MRRLYLQIYATFIAILVIFLVLLAVAWTLAPSDSSRQTLDGIGAVIGELLIPIEQNPAQLQATVDHIARLLPAKVTVRSENGSLLAYAGQALELTASKEHADSRGRGPGTATLQLPDKRWILLKVDRPKRTPAPVLIIIGLLAVAIALGALPVTRRVTRRLERLQTRVDALGAGELSARVDVEGKDEVAELARSFNRTADRIERLVNAQKQVLAGVSHEIRTPLARMRIALELLATDHQPELRERFSKDIAELDEMIGELLLATRLDTIDQLEHIETVDLLALLAEEAARTGAQVSGTPVFVQGDAKMLRRLIRNLLQNARRYASGHEVEASATAGEGDSAILVVSDQGPGVAEDERERIFEPFYQSRNVDQHSGGSVGLGLALVRKIARRHGGDVRCLPRAEGGTSFEVVLRDIGQTSCHSAL